MKTLKKIDVKVIKNAVFNKRTVLVGGVALAAAAFPMFADAATTTFGSMFTSLGSQSSLAAVAGRDIAGFAGTILGITGFMTLRNHNDRDGKKKAFIELGSGAGLMSLAFVLNSIGNTAGDSTQNASTLMGSATAN